MQPGRDSQYALKNAIGRKSSTEIISFFNLEWAAKSVRVSDGISIALLEMRRSRILYDVECTRLTAEVQAIFSAARGPAEVQACIVELCEERSQDLHPALTSTAFSAGLRQLLLDIPSYVRRNLRQRERIMKDIKEIEWASQESKRMKMENSTGGGGGGANKNWNGGGNGGGGWNKNWNHEPTQVRPPPAVVNGGTTSPLKCVLWNQNPQSCTRVNCRFVHQRMTREEWNNCPFAVGKLYPHV